MAIHTIIPTANVLMSDIRDTLNANGGSVNNNLTSFFTSSANIKKWSKKKPVDYNKTEPLTDYEFYVADYGLSNSYISKTQTPKQLMDAAIAGTDFYPYVLPSGGASSPYRLSDFCGYNTKAEAPYIAQAPNSFAPAQFPAYFGYALYLNPSPNVELKITDLGTFQTFLGTSPKLGILWTAGDDEYYLYYSSSANIDDGIYLDLEVTKSGTHHFLAVWFTDSAITEGNNDVTNEAINYVPVPDSYRSVVVTQTQIWGVVSVQWSSLNSLNYYKVNGKIQGFGQDYPYFTLTFPNGTVPDCEYRIGIYVKAVIDGKTYQGTYWYDEEHLYNPPTSNPQIMVNFPSEIDLSEILGFDVVNMNAQSIEIRLDLERVSGYGFLNYDSINVYNVTIH